MKAIYRSSFVMAAAASLTACSDSFLEQDPLSFYEPTTTYSTEAGLQSALTMCDKQLKTYILDGNWNNVGLATNYLMSDVSMYAKTDMGGGFQDNFDAKLTPTSGMGGGGDGNYMQRFWDQGFNMVKYANSVLSYVDQVEGLDEKVKNAYKGRAYFHRAYAYYNLVTDYQFNYQIAKNEPAVPIVTEETTNFTENPRATVAEVYELMLSDLGYAVQILDASTIARATKMFINADVAHGLRARVYLTMGEWDKAYADAQAAAKNYTPASIEEVSHPSFMDISEHNWLWGYDMTTDMAKYGLVQTTSSWLRSFSAEAYAPSCAVYACINNILYDKIAATDVRKGWWVDLDLKSPLLEGLTWDGDGDVANLTIPDIKEPFIPYTNVKFGCYTCGTTKNDEDTPLMRVEEMILIMAEAKAHSNEAEARKILEDFVKQYRDPSYNSNERGLKLLDEIWFQRRVELWGEGFGMKDVRRLQKPVVRFHSGQESNVPDAFRFNVAADDGWMLLRFPQREKNTNFAIVDNTGGNQPVAGQNPELKDGVTD